MKKYLKFIICCVMISTTMYYCSEKPGEEIPIKTIEITGDLSFGVTDIGSKSTKSFVI